MGVTLIYVLDLSNIQGVPTNLLKSREQYIAGSPFNFVLSGCLTRRKINAARIALFKIYNQAKQFFFSKET